MTHRLAHSFRKWCRASLLVGVSLGTFGHNASAETIAHLTRTVWGCVDPNVAPSINDASNPSHLDPKWVSRAIAEGKCVTLTPVGQWATLSQEYNGLTYVGARGIVGPSGSFWVPTSALVVDPPSARPTAPASQAVTKSPPTETSAAQKPKPAVIEPADPGSNPKNPTAAVLPTPLSYVPAPAPSQPASQSPSSQGNGLGGWILFTLVALIAFGMSRRSRSQRKLKSKPRPETRSGNLANTTETVSAVDFRIDRSSLINPAKIPMTDGASGRSKRPDTSAADRARTIVPSIDFRISGESLAPQQGTTAVSGKPAKGTWYPPGTPITVARAKIPDGMANTTEAVSAVDFRIDQSSLVNSPKIPITDSAPGRSKGPDTSAAAHATTIVPSVDFRIRGESLAPQQGTTAVSGKPVKGTWYPPGTPITVARAKIPDGMVYICHTPGRYEQHDGCFIDPALPVGSSAVAPPLGYWPSYQRITPDCRQCYLEWLASGKKASNVDIGYVFLYFYGLERRLLVDEPTAVEMDALVEELKRLRTIYSANRSFDGYSRRLVDATDFLRSAGDGSRLFAPDLTAPLGDMPVPLKVAIAREVVAGRPLGFELAAAALFGLREFWMTRRHVLAKGRRPFLAVLRARFEATFPSGFALRNHKDSSLQLVYRGAAAGLEVDLAARAGLKNLPDPTNLTWTKLFALANAVAEEVAPYAKALADYPARANSIAGLVSCPLELRDGIAEEARCWLKGLPSPAPVPFGVLASHAIGTESAKWTIRHRRQISEALSVLGYAMEPGPEEGTVGDGTIVQVFRYTGDSQSRTMVVASAAAGLVAGVAKAGPGRDDKVEEFWLSKLAHRLSLSADQMTKLRARLAWLRTNDFGLSSVNRMLGEATLEERELCAWSATVATGATGTVGKPQIAMLEAIHDVLSIPRAALYSGLHAGLGAASVSADEPVAVSDGLPEVLHPIPRPPTAEAAGPDIGRLAQIRAETERVSAMLANIFAEIEAAPEMPEHTGEGPLLGLDAEHMALTTRLLARTEWPRADFDAAATAVGLMPDGAMEAINEWAFDKYGDALVEDGDPVVVKLELLSANLDAVTAAE
jgi:TerB N-terminal domain/TerB-C domain